jgi:hypothetical protein
MRIYVLDRYAKVTKQSYWTVGLDQMTVNGAAVKVHGQDAVIDTWVASRMYRQLKVVLLQ